MSNRYDFSPLFRSSIGFDRIFDLLGSPSQVPAAQSWPPYDIERTGDNSYTVSMAVAGFGPDDLSITSEPNVLVVSGERKQSASDEAKTLHRGIPERSFTRRFQLADFVEVKKADLENGMLKISLERVVPEELKPRRIEITSSSPSDSAQKISAEPAQDAAQQQAEAA